MLQHAHLTLFPSPCGTATWRLPEETAAALGSCFPEAGHCSMFGCRAPNVTGVEVIRALTFPSLFLRKTTAFCGHNPNPQEVGRLQIYFLFIYCLFVCFWVGWINGWWLFVTFSPNISVLPLYLAGDGYSFKDSQQYRHKTKIYFD